LNQLAGLFLNNLGPILLASAAGFLVSKWLKLNPRTLSQLIFYIFSPCLVFKLLASSTLDGQDIVRTVAFAVLTMLILGLLTWGLGRLMGLERRLLAAVLIATLFMNAGNYGLPLTQFAFGESALSHASLFFVCTSLLTNSLGIVIASSGRMGLLASIKGLVRFPAIYALALGLLFNRTGWELPTPISRSVEMLAGAAIPAMLILLGMQFTNMRWDGQPRALALVTGLRMLVAPALALGLAFLMGVQGTARQALVIESSMPTAVLTTVLATEFDIYPTFMTTAVFLTTLLSPLTLTPLLAFLGA